MIKPKDPRELAIAMMSRSTCSVQVGAVLADGWGIFSWGHNHAGPDGLGEHAEHNCLKRAHYKRSRGATLYVAAQRKRNGKVITARPCVACTAMIDKRGIVTRFRDADGMWKGIGGCR